MCYSPLCLFSTVCWLNCLSESESNAAGIQTMIPKSQCHGDSNHNEEVRHKARNSHRSMTSLRCQLLQSNPRKSRSSVFIYYAIENVKSSMSLTCSSGEDVDRGTRWASRPRRSSLGNFRKSCWRRWWRFTLPGEQIRKKNH